MVRAIPSHAPNYRKIAPEIVDPEHAAVLIGGERGLEACHRTACLNPWSCTGRATLFATAAYEATGDLTIIMKVMEHTDARTAMQYQDPGLDPTREAIDQRNLSHNSRHSELREQ
jgi:hypothetical protein